MEPKTNLHLRFGQQDLEEMPLSPEVEADASEMVQGLDKHEGAELAYLTRMEIFGLLTETDKEGRKSILENPEFQEKVAMYKALKKLSGALMKSEAGRHDDERNEMNGRYLKYKGLVAQKKSFEEKLHRIMKELFSKRGKDPDSSKVMKKGSWERKIVEIEKEMQQLIAENPDVAATLEYEKVRNYSRQLAVSGFVWTESRKKLFEEAMQKSLASRPAIVFMGESGTGKTALVKALAHELTDMEPVREVGEENQNLDLKRMLVTQQIDPQKGTYWRFNGLLQAMTGMTSSLDISPRHGGAVYFDDEFNKRPSGVQLKILKFIAEAKPGSMVTIPGTDLKVRVQPKFLYVAAGNPPNDRYDREETPLEAYRELSGVLEVDYLEQDKNTPELFELLVASLMDQKTGRIRLASKKEVSPSFIPEAATGKEVLNETPTSGGYLWRFSLAWKEMFKAFSRKENILHRQDPASAPESFYLEKFVLDPGKVRDWIAQYKVSPQNQKAGISTFLFAMLTNELKSFPDIDQKVVHKILKVFGLDTPENKAPFRVLTPAEVGYFFPQVPRKPKTKENEAAAIPGPKGKVVVLPDGTELTYSDDEEIMLGSYTVKFPVNVAKGGKLFRAFGFSVEGGKVQKERLVCQSVDDSSWCTLNHHDVTLYSMLDAKPEFAHILRELESQYPKRLQTLEFFEFFEPGTKKIKAIDGKLYAPPSMDQIREAMTETHLKTIQKEFLEKGRKIKLLLTPIGMEVEKIAKKVGIKKSGCLNQNPVFTGNWDIKADLPAGPRTKVASLGKPTEQPEVVKYFVDSFDVAKAGGVTKTDLLQSTGGNNRFPGWQVLVVDDGPSDSSLPNKVPSDTLNKSAEELLADFKARGLSGMVPEEWLLFFV